MKPDAADHARQANGRSSERGDGRTMLDDNTAKPDFWGRNSNVERFVRRYLHSQTELYLLCALAEKPNKSFSFEELSALVDTAPAELGNAIMALEREGIAVTRRQERSLAASLARSPVVRDMARRLSHLSTQDEARSVLLQMVSE